MMPYPESDPTAYCQQAALNPNDASLPATREGVTALTNEINRLNARIDALTEARTNVQRRMKDRR